MFGIALLMTLLFPLLLAHMVLYMWNPQHAISKSMSSPLMKYITHLSSHMFFLHLIIQSSFQPIEDFLVFRPVGRYYNKTVSYRKASFDCRDQNWTDVSWQAAILVKIVFLVDLTDFISFIKNHSCIKQRSTLHRLRRKALLIVLVIQCPLFSALYKS